MNRAERWPRWVYGQGDDPDYRFSYANERTFLAWIRTSLALLAAGIALDIVDLTTRPGVQRGLAFLLVTLGLCTAVAAWLRWARAELAMRRGQPLPALGFGATLTLATVVISLVLATMAL